LNAFRQKDGKTNRKPHQNGPAGSVGVKNISPFGCHRHAANFILFSATSAA
jgi:hypothetical protein